MNHLTVWNSITSRGHKFYESVLNQFPKSEQSHSKVLSLGEGQSDFIATRLKESPNGVFHAVDAQLNDSFSYSKEWPSNYHKAYFQDFRIIDSNKKTIRFNEVVSSFSLNYVVDNSSYGEARMLMNNILKHMEAGATLKIWPKPTSEHWVKVVKELEKSGKIVEQKTVQIKLPHPAGQSVNGLMLTVQ